MSTIEYSEVGLKRLGRLLTASFKLQGINDRSVEKITKQIFGLGVNKDTICRLRNGNTRTPKDDTLQALAPFVLKVEYFQLRDDDQVGTPILALTDQKYDFEKIARLKTVRAINQLDDLDYRYETAGDLRKILELKTPTRRVFTLSLSTH